MPDRRPKLPQPSSKICETCGRIITWRKKWERNWNEVKFCSDNCRAHKLSAQDRRLEQLILELLQQRGRDKTICPSEAARALVATPPAEPARELWEPLMEPARAAARRLVAAGLIEITQHGHPVDASTAKGPIRLRSLQR